MTTERTSTAPADVAAKRGYFGVVRQPEFEAILHLVPERYDSLPDGLARDLVELGSSRAGGYVVEVRVAVDATARVSGGQEVGGRAVVVQMLEAMSAAQVAVQSDELAAFDETVTAGVSADLCKALSGTDERCLPVAGAGRGGAG